MGERGIAQFGIPASSFVKILALEALSLPRPLKPGLYCLPLDNLGYAMLNATRVLAYAGSTCSSPHSGALTASKTAPSRLNVQVLLSGPLTGARHYGGNMRGHSSSLLVFIFPTRACVVVASMWLILTMAFYYGGWNIILAHKTTTHQQSLVHPTIIHPSFHLPSAGPTAGDSPPPFFFPFP